MFNRAASIRIPTTVSFYLLTALLSAALLSVLRVSALNFLFGVATTLLAHAAVYLLTRERIPAWGTLFILALVVPLFPPEALTPVERGAVYWGILAGLLSYTLTYGSHYVLHLSRQDSEKGAPNGRKKSRDRHTTELFQLLNVTSSSQSVRAVRKLIQDRDRQPSSADSTIRDAAVAEVAVLQEKLKEKQSQLKQLRKKLDDEKHPRETERRQLECRLEDTQREMEETLAAKQQAEERAQSLEGFQLKVAELTQQLNTLRSQSEHDEALLSDLQARVETAESARDAALSRCQVIETELAQQQAEAKGATSACETAITAQESLGKELESLRGQALTVDTQSQELTRKLRNSQEALAAAYVGQQELKGQIEQLQAQLRVHPNQLEEGQARIASLEMEQDRAAAKMACLRSQLREKTREIERFDVRTCEHNRITETHRQGLEDAQKRIAALEDSLAFYRRTVEELTPEVDRLDEIIGRYEAAYGPPPKATVSPPGPVRESIESDK